MHISNLTVKAWNIYGIFKSINGFQYNKLHDPDFIDHIKDFLIVGIIETHHKYKCYQSSRKKLQFGRNHGELAVYVLDYLVSTSCPYLDLKQ